MCIFSTINDALCDGFVRLDQQQKHTPFLLSKNKPTLILCLSHNAYLYSLLIIKQISQLVLTVVYALESVAITVLDKHVPAPSFYNKKQKIVDLSFAGRRDEKMAGIVDRFSEPNIFGQGFVDKGFIIVAE